MDPKDQNKSENTEAAKNSTVGNAQQEKLKKAHEQNYRDEEIKKMSPKELRNKLSNKNQDYIFRLEKFLTEDQNYTMDQVEPAIDQRESQHLTYIKKLQEKKQLKLLILKKKHLRLSFGCMP